jgi:hypothetical protein
MDILLVDTHYKVIDTLYQTSRYTSHDYPPIPRLKETVRIKGEMYTVVDIIHCYDPNLINIVLDIRKE